MAKAEDIRAAVEMLEGVTDVDTVRNFMADATITAEEITAALKPVEAAPPVTDDGGTKAADPGPGTGGGGADSETDKPDNIAPSDDRTAIIMAQVENAKAAKKQLEPKLTELLKQKEDLDQAISKASADVAKADQVIEDLTSQISAADMVKKIQKQTQDRLMDQHAAQTKMDAVLKTAGVKTFASPLDQALANGARRSKVIINGEVHEAPHPRSPEGVRGYANWLHHGPRPSA